MKGIEGGDDTRRDRQLLKDLAFIKRKLRYPISKRTMPAALVIAGAIYLVSRAVWSMMILHNAPWPKSSIYIIYVIPAITILAVGSGIYAYVQTLRFKVIPTPFTKNENLTLVQSFLRSQQLLIYQLSEAPEVCQIASRPLGSPKEDRREIMVFIADDNRILVNSHFTGSRFNISSPSRNYKMMARELYNWLQANYGKEIITIRKRH